MAFLVSFTINLKINFCIEKRVDITCPSDRRVRPYDWRFVGADITCPSGRRVRPHLSSGYKLNY
ncbi:MAG: hypothetical protein FWG64_12260 [Firmicutes bacterium]|nr:hypothetical protein [Bacillota bacterium]